MKRLIAISAAALLAGCAVAQMPPPPPGAGMAWDRGSFWRGAPEGPRERIKFLQDRIDHGAADGSLDRHEAGRANSQLAGIRRWVHDMHWEDGGRLSPDQMARVQDRLDRLSSQIHWMRHNGW